MQNAQRQKYPGENMMKCYKFDKLSVMYFNITIQVTAILGFWNTYFAERLELKIDTELYTKILNLTIAKTGPYWL